MSKFYGKHLPFKACQNLTLEADICQKKDPNTFQKRPKHVPKTMQKRIGCNDRFWIAFPVSILLG